MIFVLYILALPTGRISAQTLIQDVPLIHNTGADTLPGSGEDKVYIYIQSDKLKEKDMDDLLRLMQNLSYHTNSVVSQRVVDNLYTTATHYAKQFYHYSAVRQNRLFEKAKEKNCSDCILHPGDTIALPLVPKLLKQKTSSHYASAHFVQHIDLTNASLTIEKYSPVKYHDTTSSTNTSNHLYDVSTVATLVAEGAVQEIKSLSGRSPLQNSEPEAKNWTVEMNARDLDSGQRALLEDLIRRVANGGVTFIDTVPHIDMLQLPFSDTGTVAADSNTGPIPATLERVPYEFFKDLIVIDIFEKDNCRHGRKVMDVITEKLERLGYTKDSLKITAIPINYFQNRKRVEGIVDDYLKTLEADELVKEAPMYEREFKNLKRLRGSKYDTCLNCIPSLVLSAYMKHYYSQEPDIISTSFFTNMSAFNAKPRFRACSTNLVTAALNDAGQVENADHALPSARYEPQPLTEYRAHPDKGCVIVGNHLGEGKCAGQQSNVLVAGRGVGWGTFPGHCITQRDLGTSFATPDVATSLYIAKAFWRWKKIPVSPEEARKRLFISTDLNEALINKFGSAGEINLLKLLRTDSAYIEYNDGTLVTVVPAAGGQFISISEDSKAPLGRCRHPLNPSKQDPTKHRIPSLYVTNGKMYKFDEDNCRWEYIDASSTQLKLSFNIIGQELTTLQSIEDFQRYNIRQFTILKTP